MADGSPLRDRMLFVVGARRSGTLWLQRIVSAHPEVDSVPTETYLFSYGIAQVFERIQDGLISSPRVASVYAEREPVVAAARQLCDAIFAPHARPESRLLVERTPWHAEHLELIGEIYPDSRVLHVIRDGRDVARSLVAQPWGPDTIAAAATEWRNTVLAARSAGRPEATREVRYEEVLADPEGQARELYSWLGLPVSESALKEAREESGVAANLGAGNSVGSGKWKREWGPADLREFESVAGPLLDELGYPRAKATRRRPARARVRPGRGPSRGREGATVPPDLTSPVTRPQELIERVVAALRPDRSRELAELADADIVIRIVDGAEETSARGEAGLVLVAELVAGDPAFAGRQLHGRSHPAIPTTTVALVLELPDGSLASRTLLIEVVGERVTELTVIRPAEAGAR